MPELVGENDLLLDRDSHYDVIIVGAGVAGSALAKCLGEDGNRVLAVERDLSEPNRIVGELLQPGGVQKLRELGLSGCLTTIDSPRITGYAIFQKNHELRISYPQSAHAGCALTNGTKTKEEVAEVSHDVELGIVDDDGAEAALTQMHGRSFHHGRFVSSLRNAAKAQPNVSLMEGTVTELLHNSEDEVIGVEYKAKQGELRTATAPLVIVCDGLFSKFRKEALSGKPVAKSAFVALLLEDCELPYANHGHVILAHPAPVLLYPICSKQVRCLVDIPEPVPSNSTGALRDYLRQYTAPQLPSVVRRPFLRALEENRLRSMPCGRMHPEEYRKLGLVGLGDAFNVRHPLTGGGMSVAFTDVCILRDVVRDVGVHDRKLFMDTFHKRFYRERTGPVSIVNILAQALYEVFSAPDSEMLAMQQATWQYFEYGGFAVDGTMSMLGCMTHNPLWLIAHFFSVGFVAMGRELYPIPYPHKIWNAFRIGWVAGKLIIPLMYRERLLTWRTFFPLWS